MEGGSRPPFDFEPRRQHSNKRNYSQMERSSASPLFVRQNSTPSERHASPPATAYPPLHTRLVLPPIRSHFPRDGFDFRRPAPSANQARTPQPPHATMASDVIDLTSDDDESAPSSHRPTPQPSTAAGPATTTRLPRFDREIIDLSADSNSPVQTRQPPPRRLSSPEVQFVSSRPRSRTDHHPTHVHRPLQPPDDLFLDDDDAFVPRRPGRGVNQTRPQETPGWNRVGVGAQSVGRLVEAIRHAPGAAHIRNYMPHLFERMPENMPDFAAFIAPGLMMDYETVQFNVGPDENDVRLAPPKYDPPPRAPKGFTRNPTEEDIIVCPNCEDELAIGESEEKRQVWVVKACGHVYCGTCMNNRKAKPSKSAKGKGRADEPTLPKPFSKCLAKDCGQHLSRSTAVMQIFL